MFPILRIIVLALACLSLNAYAMAQVPADEPIPATGENPAAGGGEEAGGDATMTTSDPAVDFLVTEPDFNQIIPELSAKDAEFQNIIRLIALKTGLNILLNPEEIDGKKRITFQLKNVPLGKALDTILKTHKLAYIVEAGGIIRIVPESRVGREAVETTTEVIDLNWRDAKDMEGTFKTFLTSHGSMKSNDETQTLIVTDVPPNVVKIRELISQIDRPDRQVVIEARLVDVQIQAVRNLATQWSMGKVNKALFSGTDPTTGAPIPRGTIFDQRQTNGSVVTLDAPLDLTGDEMAVIGQMAPVAVEGAGWALGRGQISFGSQIGILGDDYDVSMALIMLEGRDLVEVLASPRVTTLNNVQAKIDITQEIPYIQGEIVSQTAVLTVRFETVGEKITVKPIITPDGHVRLDINVNQRIFRNRVGPGALDPPLIDTRDAKSTVIVKDKNTVVLGGLRGIRSSEITDAWPWLWRAPVIGWLFKDKGYDKRRLELVLMVTPTIVEEALLNAREKEMYDDLDVRWNVPDYFFDDTKSSDDNFDNPDCDLPFHGDESASTN